MCVLGIVCEAQTATAMEHTQKMEKFIGAIEDTQLFITRATAIFGFNVSGNKLQLSAVCIALAILLHKSTLFTLRKQLEYFNTQNRFEFICK